MKKEKAMQLKCPYMVIRKAIDETINEFDDNNCCTYGITTNICSYKMPDCLKDRCAAWRHGRCKYRLGG